MLSITKNFPLNTLWKDLHNAFNLTGIVGRSLREHGYPELAKEMMEAVMACHSYEEALAKFTEYVIVE